MLREIINFTRSLSEESFVRNLLPQEGLHLQIELTSDSSLKWNQSEIFREKEGISSFLKKCLDLQIHTKCVSLNKAFDLPGKKLLSCNPFCLAFKVDFLNNNSEFQKSIDSYFRTATDYCTDNYKPCLEKFKCFSSKDLIPLLKSLPEFKQLKGKDYIYVYLINVTLDDFKEAHNKYLKAKVFNKEQYNKEIEGITFGVSDYLTGYNEKKPFLKHKNASFMLNSRVSSDDALILFRFSELKANKQLPNPLPIFIDKEELNEEIVKIFNRGGDKKISYQEIIKAVYEKEKDLGNYYLLNIQGENVKDFDFVSNFQYVIAPPVTIERLFIDKGITGRINNIFDFEKTIVQIIFNNQLVQKRKNEEWKMRYFDDIENNPKYLSSAMFQIVLKYRKAFYDYIYKSKQEAINFKMFYDIMKTSVLDDIRHDEFKDGRHEKDFNIKVKLNIWFSLYYFFDRPQTKGDQKDMPNQIIELNERMMEIVSDKEAHIQNDNEFAYASGQVIYYLLQQSETSNKTHALLEPFLQKSDCLQFKMAIARTFAQYKHAINFYKGRFEKLMSEVLSYDTDVNIKDLLPMILAGYFSDSIIYKRKEE